MTGQDICFQPIEFGYSREKTILEVDRLSKRGNYNDISFSLHGGEVIGITGLLGSGRTELALSLFGLNPPESGQIRINSKMVHFTSNWEAITAGIGYVPEDRMMLGLVMPQPVGSNITLAVLDTLVNRLHLIDPIKKRQNLSNSGLPN